MQRGDPMELNFESLEVQKLNVSTDRAQMTHFLLRIITITIIIVSEHFTRTYTSIKNIAINVHPCIFC